MSGGHAGITVGLMQISFQTVSHYHFEQPIQIFCMEKRYIQSIIDFTRACQQILFMKLILQMLPPEHLPIFFNSLFHLVCKMSRKPSKSEHRAQWPRLCGFFCFFDAIFIDSSDTETHKNISI